MAQGLVMFGGFLLLALVRVPIAFALLLSGMVLFTTDFRLQPWVAAQRMFSGLDSFVLLAVPFFVLAGAIMNASQVTQRLVRLAHAIVGSVRGGLGMVNVGTSMLFAGVSGSSTADTAGVGSVLIPAMRQRGYSDDFSVAVTASSSVIGTIIPPSIQMIVWGALTGTSIAALFLGGVLPGLLIGVGMMLVVYVAARSSGFPAEDRLAFREVGAALRDSLLALGIPIVVIGGIVAGLVTATEASVLAVLYALVLGVGVYRTIGVRDLPAIFVESARLASLPLFALGAAGLFGYLLAYHQVPSALGDVIGGVPAVVLLPAIVLAWLFVGAFLDALPAMAILIPVFAPAVEAAGIDPVHYGIVSVIALALGLVTPLYGLCLLLASAIAEIPVTRALRMTAAFVAVIVAVLVATIFIPELVLFLAGMAAA